MADVKQFVQSEASYPEADFKVISQATKDISRLPFFSTEKMKALQDKAKRVSSYALELQEVVGDELVSLSTKVENLGLTDSFSMLSEIDSELSKGTLDSDTTKAAQAARAETVETIGRTLGETTGKFREGANRVQAKVDEIRSVVILERTEDVLTKQQARHDEIVEEVTEKEEKKKELEEDREAIITSQDVLREKNIIDTFKDYIPSSEELGKLDLKNPEVEAIKQGVEAAKKMLGAVSEGLKYADLADARRALDGKIDEVMEEIGEKKASLKETDDLVGDLTAVMDVDSKRTLLVGEVAKLAEAWTRFADQLDNLQGIEVTETRITGIVAKMQVYLDKMIKERNSVIIK